MKVIHMGTTERTHVINFTPEEAAKLLVYLTHAVVGKDEYPTDGESVFLDKESKMVIDINVVDEAGE